MFPPIQYYWKGWRIHLSHTAAKKLGDYKWSMEDIIEILENGYESKQTKHIAEEYLKYLTKRDGKRTITKRVKVVKSYQYVTKEDVWLVRSVGYKRKGMK